MQIKTQLLSNIQRPCVCHIFAILLFHGELHDIQYKDLTPPLTHIHIFSVNKTSQEAISFFVLQTGLGCSP